MTIAALVLAVLVGVLPAEGSTTAAVAAAPPGSEPLPVTVVLQPSTVSTQVGLRFDFSTTVRNDAATTLDGLVAHLNVLSLDPAVYVDPEDWSSARTRYLQPLPAGGSVPLSWTVQAVNSGHFLLYVVVTSAAGSDEVAASPVLRASVTPRLTINPGGVLPVAIAVPVVLLGLLGLMLRRRSTLA